MFRFFRFILIFFSTACAVLSIFALIGSYKNAPYLTDSYLIDFQLTRLDLAKVLNVTSFQKRDNTGAWLPSTTLPATQPTATATGMSAQMSAALQVQAIVHQITTQFTYQDLGLADVYRVGFWGYCKGTITSKQTYDLALGKLAKAFDNDNVNITYCTPPKLGYEFDPLTVFKHELNASIHDAITGGVLLGSTSQTIVSELEVLLDKVSYKSLNLPGKLETKIGVIQTTTKAGQGIIFATAVLSVVSVVVQLLGCIMSPHNCCLSFLNFVFESAIFVLALVGSAITTGIYLYARLLVNDVTEDYGIKSFLSIQFYAFTWSATVAALLVCVFSLLGHCCGMFGTGRRRYRAVAAGPEMAYDHHHDSESVFSSGGSEKLG